jgi:hypothetical protein
MDDTKQVRFDHPLEIPEWHHVELSEHADGRIVDPDVDPSKSFPGRRRKPGHLILVGDIGWNHERPRATVLEKCGKIAQGMLAASGKDLVRALLSEGERGGTANTAGCSSDDDNLAFELRFRAHLESPMDCDPTLSRKTDLADVRTLPNRNWLSPM